jgi:peptidoglycan/xylan/chitin deacetylase (PgdA/CDA1 family)
MTIVRATLILVLLLAVQPLSAAPTLNVLCYHQIAPDARDIMTTTPVLFDAQLKYLKSHGYHGMSPAEAGAFLQGHGKVVEKPFLITFDDGYDGIFTYGLPALRRYGFTSIVFLVVGQITEHGTPHHLTWKQCESLRDSHLFFFGSHTWSLHQKIPDLLATGKLSKEGLVADLKKSKERIEKRLGTPTKLFAWPYGSYDDKAIGCARKAGYDMLFTTDYGSNHPGDGTLRIRRIRLSSAYDTVPRLEEKLNQFR